VSAGRTPLLALVFALSCLAPVARAQISGVAGVTSDYRLRGVSLTDGRAALSVSVNYDHPSGVYAGGSLVAHDPAGRPARLLGYQAYAGMSGRFEGGANWDVGVSRVDMTLYLNRPYSLDYTQAYAGLSLGGLSGRVSLAPDYPRKGVTTVYAELNGMVRPADRWRANAHVGAQARLGGSGPGEDGDRFDVSLGVAREFRNGELSVSWVAVSPRPDPRMSWTRPGVVAGISMFF
jgi:uncharacterized protein (TIGR02001 family)